MRVVWAEPLRAVSGFTMQVYNRAGDGGYLKYWLDDLKYRESKEKLPGCRACGWRGTERCEGPAILR